MIGALYKPAHQQATTARSDKLGGQGCSSPTLPSGDWLTQFLHWIICYCFAIYSC